jgi:hypothetical protein
VPQGNGTEIHTKKKSGITNMCKMCFLAVDVTHYTQRYYEIYNMPLPTCAAAVAVKMMPKYHVRVILWDSNPIFQYFFIIITRVNFNF